MLWTISVTGGPRRVNHAAVTINNMIYTFGGYMSGDPIGPNSRIDIHVLDTCTLRWYYLDYLNKKLIMLMSLTEEELCNIRRNGVMQVQKLSTKKTYHIPDQKYGHTVCAYRGKAYMWGGRNDERGSCNNLFVFDPATMEWSREETNGDRPTARDGHTSVVVGDVMYVFGGFEEEAQRFSQEVYKYYFPTRTWSLMSTRGAVPEWRDFHTAVNLGKNMYVFGGRSDELGQYHSSMDYYDDKVRVLNLESGEWSVPECKGDIPAGRRSHSAWTHRGKMYIFGGFLGDGLPHSNELFMFDPSTMIWKRLDSIGMVPSVRRRQCTVLVDNRMFLFGGTTPGPDGTLMDLADLYVLDYAPSLSTLAARAIMNTSGNRVCQLEKFLPRDVMNYLKYISEPNASRSGRA